MLNWAIERRSVNAVIGFRSFLSGQKRLLNGAEVRFWSILALFAASLANAGTGLLLSLTAIAGNHRMQFAWQK